MCVFVVIVCAGVSWVAERAEENTKKKENKSSKSFFFLSKIQVSLLSSFVCLFKFISFLVVYRLVFFCFSVKIGWK